MSKSTAVVVGVGAERGLGAALCRRFCAGRLSRARSPGAPRPRSTRSRRRSCPSGGSAEPIVTDATLEQDVVRLFDRAMAPGDGFEPADLVASNAGNNQRLDFRELTAQQFEDFWRVGCFSGFLVGREAARRFLPLGRGTVIFTGASASIATESEVDRARKRAASCNRAQTFGYQQILEICGCHPLRPP